MKKIVFALLALTLLLAPAAGCAGKDKDAAPLTGEYITVFNWGMYIADGSDGSIDVNAEFTRQTGIQVNYVTFDTNESLYSKLKTGGSAYDVIFPSDYMAGKLAEEGMLAPLDYGNIPNFALVDNLYKGRAYDPEDKYTVPYTWGTVGIIYNTKFIQDPITSWNALWNEEYKGKILMFDNSRDAFGIAQQLLGIDVNTTDEAALRRAADKLSEQKPLVQSYVMDQIFDQMQREEAWIAPYYAGDFLTMQAENENLAFCFPDEGYNLFVDTMCVPADSQKKALAEQYINFLCSPEISGKNMEFLGYSTPVPDAKAFMDEEVAASEVAYPPAETLARGVEFLSLPTATVQLMNELFDGIKASGGGWSLYVIIGGAVLLVALAAFFIIRRKKRNDY